MTITIAYGSVVTLDNEDVQEALNLRCKCGHKLSGHGFVPTIDYPVPGQTTIYVSQCVFCPIVDGEFTCRRFQAAQ